MVLPIPRLTLALLGPTGSGKSDLALQLAQTLQGSLVCLDSTTVYRHFDIGTAKPTPEDQQKVPHFLLDILDPAEPFSAFQFVEQADRQIEAIRGQGRLPIVVGGTYFYFRALQHGMFPGQALTAETLEAVEHRYVVHDRIDTLGMHRDLAAIDPTTAQKIHPQDRYRLLRALALVEAGRIPSQQQPRPLSKAQQERLWLKYALILPRAELSERISSRVDHMLEQGLLEETRRLLEKNPTARALHSIGYAECVAVLQNRLEPGQLRQEILEKTRRLAKRQMTWLRSDPEVRFVQAQDRDRIQREISTLSEILRQTPP